VAFTTIGSAFITASPSPPRNTASTCQTVRLQGLPEQPETQLSAVTGGASIWSMVKNAFGVPMIEARRGEACGPGLATKTPWQLGRSLSPTKRADTSRELIERFLRALPQRRKALSRRP